MWCLGTPTSSWRRNGGTSFDQRLQGDDVAGGFAQFEWNQESKQGGSQGFIKIDESLIQVILVNMASNHIHKNGYLAMSQHLFWLPFFSGNAPQSKHPAMPVAPPLEVVGQSRILGVQKMTLVLLMTMSVSSSTLAV